MTDVIFPDIFGRRVIAFFTGKETGVDPYRLSSATRHGKDTVFIPVQKHTDKVYVVETSREPVIADAVITRQKDILIGVQVADCVPVLLYERKREVVAAVHAGWRGTAQGIMKRTVETMVQRFFCEPEDLLVAIGPSIRWCCYEVDGDVFRAVHSASGSGDFYRTKGGKYCLDLAAANYHQTLGLGIARDNVWLSHECTFCNPARFYSYRYSRGPTGRQGGFIGLVGQ